MSIKEGYFPDVLKLAKVSLIFKKKNDLDKENYRPASVLPHILKVVERIMYHQIKNLMTNKSSKELSRFRKNHSTRYYLIPMLKMWKKMLDQGGYICPIFMDLSNAFDTLNHDLRNAKLGACRSEAGA